MLVKHILLITFIFAFFGASVFASSENGNFNGTASGQNNGGNGGNGGNGQLSLSQNMTSNWQDKGVTFTVFDVILVNTGSSVIYDATITAESNFNITKPSDIWTVEKVSPMKYHFPAYLVQNGLQKGQNLTFGYINSGSAQATFTISDIQSK